MCGTHGHTLPKLMKPWYSAAARITPGPHTQQFGGARRFFLKFFCFFLLCLCPTLWFFLPVKGARNFTRNLCRLPLHGRPIKGARNWTRSSCRLPLHGRPVKGAGNFTRSLCRLPLHNPPGNPRGKVVAIFTSKIRKFNGIFPGKRCT